MHSKARIEIQMDRSGDGVTQSTKQEDIWIEQILLLRKQMPVIIGSSFVASTLVAVGLGRYLETAQLVIWISLVSIVALARILHMQYWRRRSLSAENVRPQIRQITFFSFLSGALWAVIPGH